MVRKEKKPNDLIGMRLRRACKVKQAILLELSSETFLPELELCPSVCADDSFLTEAKLCTMLSGRQSG